MMELPFYGESLLGQDVDSVLVSIKTQTETA